MAAKKKQQEVVEEVVEEVIEESIEEEAKPKKTTTKKKEEITNDLREEAKEKLLQQVQENKEKHAKQLKLFCKINTPYVSEPNINRNIAGMFPAGTILYVEKTLNNGSNGSFYQINDKTYINQKWDVEIF